MRGGIKRVQRAKREERERKTKELNDQDQRNWRNVTWKEFKFLRVTFARRKEKKEKGTKNTFFLVFRETIWNFFGKKKFRARKRKNEGESVSWGEKYKIERNYKREEIGGNEEARMLWFQK